MSRFKRFKPIGKKHGHRQVDPVLLTKWKGIQNDLRGTIISENTELWQTDFRKLKLVAGFYISYPVDAHDKTHCAAYAAVVICDHPSMNVIHQEVEKVTLQAPYVPGFLAVRESDSLVNLLLKIITNNPKLQPDVVLVDGNGLLHPQQCGLASQIGCRTSISTIGVAKNLHLLEGIDCTRHTGQNMPSGYYALIRDGENRVLGMALKTAEKTKNPVYVSNGHKIDLETCRKVVLLCCKFRVPEPLRFADNLSREAIRTLENHCQNNSKDKSP